MILNRETIEAEEERLRREAGELPDAQRAEFYREAGKRIRDPDTYAALNWFALVGLHHFYLGRWIRGLVNLAGVALGIALLFEGLVVAGLGLIGLILVTELIELFRSQLTVAHYNNRIMEQILERIRSLGN